MPVETELELDSIAEDLSATHYKIKRYHVLLWIKQSMDKGELFYHAVEYMQIGDISLYVVPTDDLIQNYSRSFGL